MDVRPSPDRSDLESRLAKTSNHRQVKGVDVSRALPRPTHRSDHGRSRSRQRCLRFRFTRRTLATHVATPTDDFDDLLGEFVADASSARADTSAAVDSPTTETAPRRRAMNGSERPSRPSSKHQPRQERNPATSATTRPDATAATPQSQRRDASGRLHAQRDQPYAGKSSRNRRTARPARRRTASCAPRATPVAERRLVSINQVRRYHCERAIPLSADSVRPPRTRSTPRCCAWTVSPGSSGSGATAPRFET